MGTEIINYKAPSAITRFQPQTLDDIVKMATMFEASGMFPADTGKTQTAAQLAVKILAGQELGLTPFAAANGMQIIKGKCTPSANIMAAKVKGSGGRYDYRVTKMTDTEVSVEFFEQGKPLGISTFTAADAQRAGTQNMGKFPRNMLFARALSNGVRWYCPDVFNGVAVYTPDEMGATVDYETGEILSVSSPTTEPPADLPNSLAELLEIAPAEDNPLNAPPAQRLAEFDELGQRLYGNQWPQVRAHNVERISTGETTDPALLSAEQVQRLIDGLKSLQRTRAKIGKPASTNGATKPPITTATMGTLNALGTALYGEDWDNQRHKLAENVSKGAETSSKKLTANEGVEAIAELEKRIRTEYTETAQILAGSGDTDPLADVAALSGITLANAMKDLRRRVQAAQETVTA